MAYAGPESQLLTLGIIKADIGSIGGHVAPSRKLMDTVREVVHGMGHDLLLDSYVSSTGTISRF
jgi:fructose 1,6-bisphosphate aldolase/phosphatase